MVELIPLVDILESKKGETKEAHLILFEYCNLRCSFCHQDHDDRKGISIDAIMDKVDALIASTNPNDHYVINLTGGELFLDDIPDEIFFAYYEAGKRLLENFQNAIVVFGTNLVYRDVGRVVRLVESLQEFGEVKLATSYDPAGRFNSSDRELFFRNLFEVKHLVETVNVVITKQNIESILAGQEGEVFDFLCANYTVYFDHYIPSQMYQYLQPDEELISKLYLHLNDRHPNSYPIKDWRENLFNETTCRSTKIVNKNGVVTTCWSEAGKDAILDEQEGLRAKTAAEERFMEKYNCLACEYYARCGMRCFLHHSFIEDSNDVCQIKLMYDAIVQD